MALDTRLASVDELTEELQQTLLDARASVHRERETLVQEFEAQRVQLHTEYSQKLFEAGQELQEVLERGEFHVPPARLNDVLTLNVGGELFTVKRETLCVCKGSYMTVLFSGQYDGNFLRDEQGHVFLDFDPVAFELVLNWLRDKKIEGVGRSAALPSVAGEDLHHFQSIVDYLGVRHYMLNHDGSGLTGLKRDVWSSADDAIAHDTEGNATEQEQGFMGIAGSLLSALRAGPSRSS
mmetsp:Transcript_57057/g.105488  ORF Transcript_57057/g.105488 Transcript_57057/m.105488 type:complete len:237 (+) Transcript_57057:120-830(+)